MNNKIFIYKGDDTTFATNEKFITFYIESDLDLTGWKAIFNLGCLNKKIDDISFKSFEVNLTNFETANLKLGELLGSVRLIDNKNRIKTVINDIPFEVTNKIIENQSKEIDLTIPETAEINMKLKIGNVAVSSVNGKTGAVTLTASDVGALPINTIIPSANDFVKKEEFENELSNLATIEYVNETIGNIEALLREV